MDVLVVQIVNLLVDTVVSMSENNTLTQREEYFVVLFVHEELKFICHVNNDHHNNR